jgi:tetratricopeptide (TPR) repeat protein
LGLRNHLFRCEAEAGYQALKAKNFEQAEKFFSGPYEVKINLGLLDNWRQSGGRTEWHKWTATQHCGRALALVGQGEWEEALTAIEEAQLHHMVYFRHDQQKPCLAETGMHKIHGRILEELGRTTEAKAARSKASLPPTAYPTEVEDFRGWNRPYEVFDEKLMKLETWVAEKK